MGRPSGDPGWDLSLRMLLLVVVPGYLHRWRRGSGGRTHRLVELRQQFLSFTSPLVLVTVVVIGWVPGAWCDCERRSVGGWAVTTAAGGVALLVVGRLIERPLDCSTDEALAHSYRSRMLVRIASAESAALVGFVGAQVTGAWWIYCIGLAVAAVGFVRAAPSARDVTRSQEALRRAGCGRSIVATLGRRAPREDRAAG